MPVVDATTTEVSHKGDVRDVDVEYATSKVRSIADTCRERVHHIEVRLVLDADRGRERPAQAEAALDIDGRTVRAHVRGEHRDRGHRPAGGSPQPSGPPPRGSPAPSRQPASPRRDELASRRSSRPASGVRRHPCRRARGREAQDLRVGSDVARRGRLRARPARARLLPLRARRHRPRRRVEPRRGRSARSCCTPTAQPSTSTGWSHRSTSARRWSRR